MCARYERSHSRNRRRKGQGSSSGVSFSKRHPQAKGKDWIMKKKELRRKRGYMDVPEDTKYVPLSTLSLPHTPRTPLSLFYEKND